MCTMDAVLKSPDDDITELAKLDITFPFNYEQIGAVVFRSMSKIYGFVT